MPLLTVLVLINNFHLDFIYVQTYKDEKSSLLALGELTEALSGLGQFRLI